jgi:hypothetical protein
MLYSTYSLRCLNAALLPTCFLLYSMCTIVEFLLFCCMLYFCRANNKYIFLYAIVTVAMFMVNYCISVSSPPILYLLCLHRLVSASVACMYEYVLQPTFAAPSQFVLALKYQE